MRKTVVVAFAILGLGLAQSNAWGVDPAPVAAAPGSVTVGAPSRAVGTALEPSDYLSRPLTVPAETEASVQLLSGIHTRVSRVDDPVAGKLLQPIYVDGQMALPSGSLLYGRVTHVRAAGRMHRAAELAFRFEQISLPNGDTEPINAVLASLERPGHLRVDHEGYITAGRGFSWKQLAFGAGAGGALVTVGVKAGAMGAILPAGAVGLVGYEILWPRGDEVHLPPNTRCTVRLDYSLTVRGQS